MCDLFGSLVAFPHPAPPQKPRVKSKNKQTTFKSSNVGLKQKKILHHHLSAFYHSCDATSCFELPLPSLPCLSVLAVPGTVSQNNAFLSANCFCPSMFSEQKEKKLRQGSFFHIRTFEYFKEMPISWIISP